MKMINNFKNKYHRFFILFIAMQLIIISIFLNNNYLHQYKPFQSMAIEISEIIIGIIIFIFNILAIVIIKKYLANYYFPEKKDGLNQVELAQVLQENKIHRQVRHDLKNHLNVIYELAREGELDKLQNYLSQYIDRLDATSLNINVGIKELDVLIYSKIVTARNLNIDVHFKSSVVLRCNNKYIIDLVSILGNLLDNAIEACCQLEDEKKMVISLKEDPVDYTIKITNTFQKANDFKLENIFKESYSTKKEDRRGEGLSIVKKTVKRLDGKINTYVENQLFQVKIEIPKHVLE